MSKVLLPERHPTKDFFIADIFDALPVKDDRHTMEHPFFTLSTKPDVRTVRYQKNGVSIKLSPHFEYGLPTMMDKDILLFLGSLVMAELNKGGDNLPPRTVRFTAHDLLVTTNRDTSGPAYALLKKAFERLNGVSITTDIETGGIRAASGFHLIDRWDIIEKSRDDDRMVKLEATLSDWFYRALVNREVLTINRDYFRLRKMLERRLYELARKHCGQQRQWCISLAHLYEKTGSRSPMKKFRYQLRQIIEADKKHEHFPDYRMALDGEDRVTFTRKDAPEQATQWNLSLQNDWPKINRATIEKARKIVAQVGTGWDLQELQRQFSYSIVDGFQPENVNAAFIGFVRSKIVRCP